MRVRARCLVQGRRALSHPRRPGRARRNVTAAWSSELPILDLSAGLDPAHRGFPAEAELACAVLSCLRRTGCLLARDPRVTHEDNDVFLDMFEDYFDRPDDVKAPDARPEKSYQARIPAQHGIARVILARVLAPRAVRTRATSMITDTGTGHADVYIRTPLTIAVPCCLVSESSNNTVRGVRRWG
jgi:hypothetical protein